jgi:hypothetical protein
LPATFRRSQLDSREDLRKRFRVRDRAHQISLICPLFSQHVSRKSAAVVVVVVVLIKDSIFDVDAPPPPSSSVVVLFDHFCAKNLTRF